MKYTISTKECYLHICVRAGWGENFDENAMNAFARAALRCFMKPESISRKKINFSGPIGISLYERLRKPMDKRFFLCILEHIVIAAEKVRSNNLAQDNIILDLHHVYINEQTKELRFLYVPTDKPQPQVDFSQFVEMIVYSVRPEGPDAEFLYRFNNYLKSMGRFEYAKIEKFVSQEDNSVVTALKKQYTGLSGYMTDKPKHYYDHYANEEETNVLEDEKKSIVLGDEDATSLLRDPYADADATSLLRDPYADADATSLLRDPYADADATSLLRDPYADADATSLLRDPYADADATSLLRDSYADADATGLLYEFDEDQTGLFCEEQAGSFQGGYDETGLLTDFEGTMLLEEEGTVLLQEEKQPCAELYRVSTGETIEIHVPVFRLGKGHADYVVNNPAVSRSHAEIIDRGGQFYIIDLESTNHTYINSKIIPARYETEIQDGDRLKLANEEFVFHIVS